MVARVEVGGKFYPLVDYTVAEEATPLAAGDPTGSTGELTFTITAEDEYLSPGTALAVDNPAIFLGEQVKLWDNFKGYTIGKVVDVAKNLETATITVHAFSALTELNVFNVRALPKSDTVQNVFAYYVSLSRTNIQTMVLDVAGLPNLSTRIVHFPGWFGDLWFHLKQMAYALDADISLVSGIIVLRPIRARVATRGRDVQRTIEFGVGQLARSVEVYSYSNREIAEGLIYPAGGWSDEVSVITVNAGETVEEILEVSASLTSVVQPEFREFVGRFESSESVFTVVGNDGLPVTESAFRSRGGRLRVRIGEDTKSLVVSFTAPSGIPGRDGKLLESFSLALSDSEGTGRYSTLRILGSGVAFNRQVVTVPTGVALSESGTDVGVTIDNPFISSKNIAVRAGLRAAQMFNGAHTKISGTVVAINRRGDSGIIVGRLVSYVQNMFNGQTVSQVLGEWGSFTNAQIMSMLNSPLEDEFDNQVFGNVNGARVWDEYSRRWYRVRSSGLVPDGISFEAEDDLVWADMSEYFSGMSCADVQARYSGLSYRQANALGVPRD